MLPVECVYNAFGEDAQKLRFTASPGEMVWLLLPHSPYGPLTAGVNVLAIFSFAKGKEGGS